MLHYLSDDEKISTITAWCAADNVGSRRALEKSGMVKASVEEGALEIGDSVFDKVNYEYRGKALRS